MKVEIANKKVEASRIQYLGWKETVISVAEKDISVSRAQTSLQISCAIAVRT